MDTFLQYRNDFLVRLRFESMEGTEVAPPGCDWEAKFSTSVFADTYTAMCVGGTLVRARREDDTIIVALDGHGLMPGDLWLTFTADIPAMAYPDGLAHVNVRVPTGIHLTDGRNCGAAVSGISTVIIRLPLSASDLAGTGLPDNPGNTGCGCAQMEAFTTDDIRGIIDEVCGGDNQN